MWKVYFEYYGREKAFKNHIKVDPTVNPETGTNAISTETEKIPDKKLAQRWTDRAKEMLQSDNQLRTTITLINMLQTAKLNCPKKHCSRQELITFIKKQHIPDNAKLIIELVKG